MKGPMDARGDDVDQHWSPRRWRYAFVPLLIAAACLVTLAVIVNLIVN